MKNHINILEVRNSQTIKTKNQNSFKEKERAKSFKQIESIINKETSTIDLSGKGLLNYPKQLLDSEFYKIKQLLIFKNEISEISESIIKALPTLKIFEASFNKIGFITPSISLWKDSLAKLKLSNNKLTQLPSEICELSNLRKLDISNNLIQELPYAIGNLANLKSLIMDNNPSLKAIPTSMAQLKRLQHIEFEWIIYAPKSIGNSYENGQSESK